ncbi:hypothetical protein J2S78_001956 [Salibacterium salarium]|uniref:DUF3866 family protein n=1 Tax=Salibacterium salarium TaxID=284579 RepID=UPI002781A594|nr:DUF3866 family protein [Salibacterium salarium]MDQ0299536.1 hypothetical protein [Salibacterium salarium]
MYQALTVQVTKVIQKTKDFLKLETNGGARRAVLYLCCCEPVNVGDYIKVNTTANLLDLGTGGWDIAITTFHNKEKVSGEGHIMKARYTPLQHSVFAIDSPEHPDHSIFQSSFSLQGKPVLLAELHSMLPIILLLFVHSHPYKNIGVILSDEASLAAGLSDHMTEWKQHDRIHIVTTGQAFGGTEEAVTIVNAIQWLVVKQNVDNIIISMGPGTAGTATPFGYSGMALANWSNIVGSLAGRPIWVPRISFKDKRERHVGLSHHTVTPLHQFTHVSSELVLPQLKTEQQKIIESQLTSLRQQEHIKLHYQNVNELLEYWIAWYENYALEIHSMGTVVDDNVEFLKGVLAPVKHILDL